MRALWKPASLFAWSAAAILVPGCGGGESAGAGEGPRARNVLLIVADTLRADRLGCYGYERDTSPEIDALAAEGVLWESCHSQACWTLPSMISLMAGVPVTRRERALPTSLPVVAETLRASGMTTAAFLGNATVGVDRGFERGFDHFGEVYNERASTVADHFEAWYRDWLGKREAGGAGFFAWVHFIDPHHPYEPLEEHDLFSGSREGYEQLESRWLAEAPRVPELSPGVPGLPGEDAVRRMNELSNLYDGEVRAVDDAVGRLIEILRETGELEDTLVVFCSDHGEMLYEQANFPYLIQQRIDADGGLPDGVMDLFGAGHRPWYFEPLWRTPLVIAGPGMPRGVRRGGLAANLDIYPTILEALGLSPLAHLDGEGLLGGREPTRERVFAHGHRTTAVLDRSGSKLVAHWRRSFNLPRSAEQPLELFDLRSDPSERDNLAQSDTDRARAQLEAIDVWRAENERDVIDTQTERAERILRELGYMGDEPPPEEPKGPRKNN